MFGSRPHPLWNRVGDLIRSRMHKCGGIVHEARHEVTFIGREWSRTSETLGGSLEAQRIQSLRTFSSDFFGKTDPSHILWRYSFRWSRRSLRRQGGDVRVPRISSRSARHCGGPLPRPWWMALQFPTRLSGLREQISRERQQPPWATY